MLKPDNSPSAQKYVQNALGMVVCEYCMKSNGEHNVDDECIDNLGHLLGTNWKPLEPVSPSALSSQPTEAVKMYCACYGIMSGDVLHSEESCTRNHDEPPSVAHPSGDTKEEEGECQSCFRMMNTRDGCEPTKYCDTCAQDLLKDIEAVLDSVRRVAPSGAAEDAWIRHKEYIAAEISHHFDESPDEIASFIRFMKPPVAPPLPDSAKEKIS